MIDGKEVNVSREIVVELEAATQRINAFSAAIEAGSPLDASAMAAFKYDVNMFATAAMSAFHALTELVGQIDKGEFRDSIDQDLKLNVHYLNAKKLLET